MTKSLNDLPYQVYLENIVPVIDIKDAGNLSMTSKVLKNIFDSNEIWKYLYFKTNPPKISDKSIHIGPHSKYKHMKKEELLEKFSVRRPIYWPRYGNIYRTWSSDSCCCSGISKLVPNLIDINSNLTIGNIDTTLHYIDDQPEKVKNEYYNIIKKIHIKENKSNNLSTVNLCRNTSHYIQSTLEYNNKNSANYESFKLVTIEKLKTKYNKKLENQKYKLEQKNKKRDILLKELKKLELELSEIEKEKDKLKDFLSKSSTGINIYKGRRVIKKKIR